jgi:hypothetical protein
MDALGKLRKLNYLIGNWFCNLPAYNIVLQPTMLPRVPGIFLGVRGVKCCWHIQITTTLPSVSLISRKCGILYVSHPPRSPWPGTGTAFTLFFIIHKLYWQHQFKVVHIELSSTQTCKTIPVIIGTVYPCAVAHRIWRRAWRAEYTLRWWMSGAHNSRAGTSQRVAAIYVPYAIGSSFKPTSISPTPKLFPVIPSTMSWRSL